MPSSFKLAPEFETAMLRLQESVMIASNNAMAAVMALAESDAKKQHRWRQQGQYTEESRGGSRWTWEVTGASEDSITGYVVSNTSSKRLNSVSPRESTVTLEYGDRVVVFRKRHNVDAGLTGNYATAPGQVLGVLTMYTEYAGYLQGKEISGTTLPGGMGPGEPITIEILENQWAPVYSRLLGLLMTSEMTALTKDLA